MNLEDYEKELNKQFEKRTKERELQIKKLYQKLLAKVNKKISSIYAKYETEGILNKSDLLKYDRLSNLKKEISKYIDELYKSSYNAISKGLELEYIESYKYMAYSLEMLSEAVIKYDVLTEELVKSAINNPVSGLTLSDTLNVHRATIIRDIDRTITQGVFVGKTYGTMAKEIKKVLDDNYVKAVRVARTEAHRVNEQGKNNSALIAHNQGIKQVKKWVTMKDGRVRPLHRKMNGVEIPLDEDFVTTDGKGKGPYPGSMGSAQHDCNCRCITRRRIVSVEENTKKYDGEIFNQTYSEWSKNKKI